MVLDVLPFLRTKEFIQSLVSGMGVLLKRMCIHWSHMWLDHPSFKVNIASWWNTSMQGRWEGFRFMEKLRFLKG